MYKNPFFGHSNWKNWATGLLEIGQLLLSIGIEFLPVVMLIDDEG
jgi:hypothetical protein